VGVCCISPRAGASLPARRAKYFPLFDQCTVEAGINEITRAALSHRANSAAANSHKQTERKTKAPAGKKRHIWTEREIEMDGKATCDGLEAAARIVDV